MHYPVKKIVSFAIIPILISSCAVMSGKVDIKKSEIKSDCAEIKAEIPYFSHFNNKEFEDKLNSDYENNVRQLIDNFNNRCKNDNCSFTLTQDVKYAKAPIISVVGELYEYTEGAHGTNTRIATNIDTEKNIELSLSDIFSENIYPDILNQKIENIIDNNPEEYSDLWEKPVISSMHEKYFYFTDKGLVIFYPPYELSYYARGFVEFCIPYKEIAGYLKPEYKSL